MSIPGSKRRRRIDDAIVTGLLPVVASNFLASPIHQSAPSY